MKHIVAVEFNIHYMPEFGLNREFYKVGDTTITYMPGATERKCIELKEGKDDHGAYVEARFNDDTFDRVYNHVKVVYAEENAFNRIIGEDNEVIKSK